MNCLCVQDEYPYYRSKLTGFLFTQTFLLTVTAMLASCTTSLSLCKSFSKNSFFLLSTTYNYLSVCFRCRSFLKADAKVWLFLIPRKTLAKKNAIFMWFLTLVYITYSVLWAHTLLLLRASAKV